MSSLVTIAAPGYTCSTLVVGGFTHSSFEGLVKHFRSMIENADKEETKVKYVHTSFDYGTQVYKDVVKEKPILGGHQFRQFGFAVGTISFCQSDVIPWLERLGFVISEPGHNLKNNSTCRLVYAPIPKFLKLLKEAEKEIAEKSGKKAA